MVASKTLLKDERKPAFFRRSEKRWKGRIEPASFISSSLLVAAGNRGPF